MINSDINKNFIGEGLISDNQTQADIESNVSPDPRDKRSDAVSKKDSKSQKGSNAPQKKGTKGRRQGILDSNLPK